MKRDFLRLALFVLLALVSCNNAEKYDELVRVTPHNRLIHVIGYGQSLMSGAFSGAPVSNNPSSDNVFAFNGGVRTYDVFGLDMERRTYIVRKGSPTYGELFLTPKESLSSYDLKLLKKAHKSLRPIVEERPSYKKYSDGTTRSFVKDSNGDYLNLLQQGETVLTGFCEGYNSFFYSNGGIDYDLLASCAAYGSATFESLLPLDQGGSIHGGEDGSNLNYFEVLMAQVFNGKRYADEFGIDYSVDYILYFEEHTDQDESRNPKIAACRVLQLFTIINNRVRAITNQRNDIVFILPNSNLTNEALTLAASMIVNGEGALALSDEEKIVINGLPNSDIVPYYMDNVYAGVAHYGYELGSDNIHHTSLAQRQIGFITGYNIARAIKKPLYPKTIEIKDNNICILYGITVPPIVLDGNAPGGVQTNPDIISRGDKYGFLIKKDGIIQDIIKEVIVVGPNQINILCSTSPKGMTLEYALSSTSHRRYGNVRDSQGGNRDLANWGYSFRVML